jgi:DNA-binding transcriptional LysR family regulator
MPAVPTRSRPSRTPRAGAAIDVRALEIFVAVAQAQGMTAAARQLGITQPAVSLAIAHLEEALGTPLVDRSTRPLRTTPAGQVLLRRASRVLADVAQLRGSVSQSAGRPLSNIRIGIVASITALGAPLILALQALADELRIWSTLTPDLRDALLERKLDVLVTSESLESIPHLARRVVLREPFVLAIPRDFALARRSLTLASLAESLPFIRYTSRSNIGESIERYLRRRRVNAPRQLELDTSTAVHDMVAAGLGWAMTTPLCLIQSGVSLDAVALRPLDGTPLRRALHVIARDTELPGAVDRIGDVVSGLAREVLSERLRGRHAWLLRDVDFL